MPTVLVEVDPPAELPPNEVVVLQPYGSLFFAAAPLIEAMLPAVGSQTSGSVVILRLRGRTDLGVTFIGVLHRYTSTLVAADSKLKLSAVSDRVLEQLRVAGITDVIDTDDLYLATTGWVPRWHGRATAHVPGWRPDREMRPLVRRLPTDDVPFGAYPVRSAGSGECTTRRDGAQPDQQNLHNDVLGYEHRAGALAGFDERPSSILAASATSIPAIQCRAPRPNSRLSHILSKRTDDPEEDEA